jgi:hypothetical protein
VTEAVIPDRCQQPDCDKPVETWCPLCDQFLCKEHDALVPERRHQCLGDRSAA